MLITRSWCTEIRCCWVLVATGGKKWWTIAYRGGGGKWSWDPDGPDDDAEDDNKDVLSVRVVYPQGVSINCNCSLSLTMCFSLPLPSFFLCNILFHSVTQCLFTLTHSFPFLIWQLLINEINSQPIKMHLTRAASWHDLARSLAS